MTDTAPSTSVIILRGPVGKIPVVKPSARSLARRFMGCSVNRHDAIVHERAIQDNFYRAKMLLVWLILLIYSGWFVKVQRTFIPSCSVIMLSTIGTSIFCPTVKH